MENPRATSAPDLGGQNALPRAITKILVPSQRGSLLARPRLVNFLHDHIDRKLQLVSASAGYGKTSLLISFAHETTIPVCWYGLDASDGDPKIFVEYLIASLRRRFPHFGVRSLGMLAETVLPRDLALVVGTLVTEIYEDIQDYFVLVLDDYQTIEDSESINLLLDALLRLLPENAHILLSSRTLPARLTLTRLTARQEIAGLGVDDLRFTAPEIRTLIHKNYGVEITDEQALQLAQQSEGWITAILLSQHSLWQGLLREMVRLQAPHSQVYSYLASEVFAQQTPDVQRFLLESSILDQPSPTDCDEVLEIRKSEDLLRVVERKNLFITRLEEDRAWYRYHHLFQEFLQHRLKETEPDRWRDLHERAAVLCAARGEWDQAIAHWVNAQALEQAAGQIERVAKAVFDAGHWVTLAKWIDTLTEPILTDHPDLLVCRAMIHSNTGEIQRASQIYDRTLILFEQRHDARGIARTLIEQATLLRFQGAYPSAIDNCRRALGMLGDEASGRVAKAHRTLGIALGLSGDASQNIAELEAALALYESLGDLTNIALIHHDLGVAHRTAGSPQAARHFQEALDHWRRAGNSVGLSNTLNSVGVGYHRQGEYAKAIETLEQARDHARRSGQLRIEAFVLASLGDVYRDEGKSERARETYQSAFEIARRIDEGFVITYILIALAETYRLGADLPAAEQLIQQALEQATAHHSRYEIGLVKAELGILASERGDFKNAQESLAEALDLLERSGVKHDCARVHLHLANTYFAQRRYRLTNLHLKATAGIGAALRQDQFVVSQGRQMIPLLSYAASKRIGESYFTRVAAQLKQQPTAVPQTNVLSALVPQVPRLQVRAFGSATVLRDGKLVTKTDWDSASARELFFFLLAHPHGMRKEQILATLWDNVTPSKANGIFHSTAWRLRRALAPDCLVYENGLYRLNSDLNLDYDVAHLTEFARAAERETVPQARADYLLQAVALYQGDYLEDMYSDWCTAPRSDLLHQYLSMLLELVHYFAAHAEPNKAVAWCRKILDKDNYREDVYRELMRLQAREGNPTAALRTYQRCIEVLEDAHLSPSPDTLELAAHILSGEQIE